MGERSILLAVYFTKTDEPIFKGNEKIGRLENINRSAFNTICISCTRACNNDDHYLKATFAGSLPALYVIILSVRETLHAASVQYYNSPAVA